MSQNINDLHNSLAIVCPINGVSVGVWADKATWRIDFNAAASALQKTAAQNVVTAWDINAPPTPMTPTQKITAVGITLGDLQSVLGLPVTGPL